MSKATKTRANIIATVIKYIHPARIAQHLYQCIHFLLVNSFTSHKERNTITVNNPFSWRQLVNCSMTRLIHEDKSEHGSDLL